MRRRRRGGILIVSSGAAYGGSPHLAVYSAAKAFQINFAESLWAEMGPHGVDVCTIVLGRTDTPAYRRRREKQGIAITNHGLASPDEVAQLALDRLAHGPVVNWGLQDNDPGFMCLSAADRRRRVETLHKLLSEDNDYLFTANG